MKVNQKIKAFTLVELVVVIAISTIVAGLAFSVIRLVQKNTSSIAVSYSDKSKVQSLELSLNADFNNFTQIVWEESKEELQFKSPINEKIYYFSKDSITVSGQTFKIKLLEKELYFRGEKVAEKEIDALKLIFELSGKELPIFVYKHNDLTTQFIYGN